MRAVIQSAPKNLTALSSSPKLVGLIAMPAVACSALAAGEELPTRLKLFNWGDNETATKGVFKVGKATLSSLAANQAKFGFDKIALDFNHNSLKGHPNYQPDPRLVAAYGVPEVVEGDGVYVTALSYTPSGQKFAKEYADLSPTPLTDENGEVIFLHSVALCPQGEVKNLSFLSADFLTALSAHNTPPNKSMDYKKAICALLGLDPASATDQDIEAGLKKLGEKNDPDKDGDAKKDSDKDGDGAKPDDSTALGIQLAALTKQVTALSTLVQGVTQKTDSSERSALLEQAARDGKLVPLTCKTLPLDVLAKIVGELPAGMVPVDQRTPESGAVALSVNIGVNDTSAEIRKNLGISEDAWKAATAKK